MGEENASQIRQRINKEIHINITYTIDKDPEYMAMVYGIPETKQLPGK